MTNAIRSLWLGLGLAMASFGLAAAGPGDGSGAGSGSGSGATTSEKAGTDESLQNGGDTRPWAAGVTKAEQEAALKLFHDGNLQLNDGLFAKAAEHLQASADALGSPGDPLQPRARADEPRPADRVARKLPDGDEVRRRAAAVEGQVRPREGVHPAARQADRRRSRSRARRPGAKVSVDGKEVFTAPGTWQGQGPRQASTRSSARRRSPDARRRAATSARRDRSGSSSSSTRPRS